MSVTLMEMFTTVLSWATTTLDIEVNNNDSREILHLLSPHICCLVPSFLLQNSKNIPIIDTRRERRRKESKRGRIGDDHHHHHDMTTTSSNIRNRNPFYADEPVTSNIAQNLAIPLKFTKAEILDAPKTILHNFVNSFMHLLQSRLRNIIRAVIEQSSGSNDSSNSSSFSRNCSSSSSLVAFLSDRSLIQVRTVVTSFRMLTNDQNTRLLCNNSHITKNSHNQNSNEYVSLPVLFEATIDLDLFHGKENISSSFTAPGTITGSFVETATTNCNTNIEDQEYNNSSILQIENVEVNLETSILLESMVEQARIATKKAFEFALKASKETSAFGPLPSQSHHFFPDETALGHSASVTCSNRESINAVASSGSVNEGLSSMMTHQPQSANIQNSHSLSLPNQQKRSATNPTEGKKKNHEEKEPEPSSLKRKHTSEKNSPEHSEHSYSYSQDALDAASGLTLLHKDVKDTTNKLPLQN
jgi:hypothetical protein